MAPLRVALAVLAFNVVLADVVFSRSIDTLNIGSGKLTLDGTVCTGTDGYGSNNCDLNWGSSYTGHVTASLTKDIEAGSQISIDAKVDSFIPFKTSCAACGENCTVTIPIVKKTVTFPMPPCPLSAQSLDKALKFTLPATAPLPLKAGVKGDATLTDAGGAVLAKVSFEASLSPSASEADLKLSQCKKVPYDYCCAVGKPCDCTKGTTAPNQCKPESYLYCCNVGTPCDCSQPPALL